MFRNLVTPTLTVFDTDEIDPPVLGNGIAYRYHFDFTGFPADASQGAQLPQARTSGSPGPATRSGACST